MARLTTHVISLMHGLNTARLSSTSLVANSLTVLFHAHTLALTILGTDHGIPNVAQSDRQLEDRAIGSLHTTSFCPNSMVRKRMPQTREYSHENV